MADFVDAANGLADAITSALTLGTGGTSALIGGNIVKVYVGWPNSQTLDADLAAGKVNISVWPTQMEKVTAVYEADDEWIDDSTTSASIETRRQARRMQVSIWASTPTARDTIAKAIDAALSTTFNLTLSDGSAATLRYRGGQLIDSRQTANLYRRDAYYEVSYATIQTMAATPINTITTTLEIDVNGVAIATTPIVTT